jgi:very-short-patch-repair endonuclease
VWKRIGAIAAGQHGVVSRNQLRRAGASEETIDWGIAAGRLFTVFRAAYSVGHPGVSRGGRLLAAVLACGEGSIVSHGTAAALHGLWEHRPLDVDVIAPIQAGRKIAGIRRRFVPPPPAGQRTLVDGVPCTSVSRTVVDLAGFLRGRQLAAVIEQAAVQRALDVAEIDSILLEQPRRGARRLSNALEPWRRYSPRVRVRSRMEAKLLPLLTLHFLPVPDCNAKLRIGKETFEVDFLWRPQKVVVETDGGRFHDNPVAQARDGHRNRVLARAEYKVLRLGWWDIANDPERAIAELKRFLASAPAVP